MLLECFRCNSTKIRPTVKGQVNITIHKLEKVVVRLNVRLKDVFPDEF